MQTLVGVGGMALRARIVPSGDQAAGAPVPRMALRMGCASAVAGWPDVGDGMIDGASEPVPGVSSGPSVGMTVGGAGGSPLGSTRGAVAVWVGSVGSVCVLGGAEPSGPIVGDEVGSGEGATGNATIANISSPSGSRPAMKRGAAQIG